VDLWGMRQCSLVGGYGYFSGTRCFHFHGVSRTCPHTGTVPNIAPIMKESDSKPATPRICKLRMAIQPIEDEMTMLSRKSGTNHPATWHHNPEDGRP
jgi:hypothetical protein